MSLGGYAVKGPNHNFSYVLPTFLTSYFLPNWRVGHNFAFTGRRRNREDRPSCTANGQTLAHRVPGRGVPRHAARQSRPSHLQG